MLDLLTLVCCCILVFVDGYSLLTYVVLSVDALPTLLLAARGWVPDGRLVETGERSLSLLSVLPWDCWATLRVAECICGVMLE